MDAPRRSLTARVTVSFIIQTGTLLGAKQSSWRHSAVARCPGPPYLLQEQRHSRSGWEETGARATGLLTHPLPHSFIHPATLALASTWGPMEESPPLNSRRGRREVYQGEQTPRGAPEANSVTPSSSVPSMTPPLRHWRPACGRCWGLGTDGPGPGPGASLGGLGPGVSPLDLCPVTLCA